LRGSSTHHQLRQHVLLLERELDPRSPCFEDAGLRSNGGGEVQLQGDRRVGPIADAAAKCEIGFEARMQNIGARAHLRSRSLPWCQGRV